MNQRPSSTLLAKAKAYAVAHKAISAGIAAAVLAAGYGAWSHAQAGTAEAKYVLATAAKGTLISSVSGSGQVAAENQVSVTSAVSGDVNGVYVENGEEVRQGQLLATVESSDAVRAVRNAELSLENAKVAYDKAKKQAADQAPASTASDLAKAYQAGYNAIVATAIDLPAIFSGVSDIYYSSSHSPYFSDTSVSMQAGSAAAQYKLQAGSAFDDAKAEYDANFLRFKNISANSSPDEVVSLLNETNVILKKLLGALSGTYSTIDFIQSRLAKVPSELASDKSALSTYVGKVNSDTASVTSALSSIDDAKTSGASADLGMRSAELSVSQAEAALSDAQKALADHQVRAPFDGLVAKVSAKVGDKAANGTAVATVVTARQLVNISLNEIDAAKVAKGDKATLTFDAIDGLTLAGHVSNVDLVGTVSQGVVSYSVEIVFDDVDARVKPGMTVNANIIAKAKQDVLLVPSSAVKSQSSGKYVLVLPQKYSEAEAAAGVSSSEAPQRVMVTVGDSNDSSVEIVSGISEGDQVVARTAATAKAISATPSILNSIGGARAGGAAGATRNVQFISR